MKAAIGYRHAWRDVLLAPDAAGPDALEVLADHFFWRPAAVAPLAERYPIVLHDVGCSVASGGPDPARLVRIREVARRAGAVAFTDHLALTRAGGIDLGHLCPFRYDRVSLGVVIDGVRRLQDTLGVPVALENAATPFALPGPLSEAEMWHALVDATGCGLLLDLTNVLLDARNAGADPWDRIAALPLRAVSWVHLAGGRAGTDAHWVDSHSAPVEDASYALLRRLRGHAALEGAIVERDAHLPPMDEIVAEARRAVAAWSAP